jgi:acyl-CoA synthetase (AMP-forming)/AMP-acid ligase II
VILSHRSLAFETTRHVGVSYSSARPLLSGSPVTHASGMLVSLLVPPLRGEPIFLVDGWDPAVVLDGMRTDDLTAGWGAAIFLTSLLDHPDFGPADLARIERAYVGGSPIPSALVERAESMGIWVGRSYGCTEQPTISFMGPDDPLDKRITTNGRPMLGVEVKAVDPDGNQLPPGLAGELWSRGPDRSSGYVDPGLTAEAFEPGGWFRTGDIGALDAEGYLTITDRLKDIIIRGGENISAAEVEGFLLQLPGVAEVAVVAAPDPRYGERACAFVRTRPGAEGPDLGAVRRHLQAAGLARQKWPEDLRTVDDLPRTPSGKIKKSALRDLLRTGEPGPTT